jgi:hypothetical protein
VIARVARATLLTKLALAGGGTCAAVVLAALLLLGWLAVIGGQGAAASCGAGAGEPVRDGSIPHELMPLFEGASAQYRLGSRGPATLAAITSIESDFGRNLGPSSAGAVGWTQFMPGTWRRYGVDADGDDRADPNTAADAIYSAARYLQALGAPQDWPGALFGYNHATWYVEDVLARAERYLRAPDGSGDTLLIEVCEAAPPVAVGESRRVFGGGRIVSIPGSPGQLIDERLLNDIAFLKREFRIAINAGYAPTGHKAGGEHPLGLALDIVPGPGGSWDDIDRLARWAEPRQDQPRAPWRWVGYDGDADHGRGNHLHLSWLHGPAPGHTPPAQWVMVLAASP